MKKFSALLILVLLMFCWSCSGNSEHTIVVGATSSPHALVLENCVKDILAENGWKLEVISYGSYEVINPALASGNLDANYFQHRPYLDSCNESDGTDLVAVCSVHYEPLGIYSVMGKTLDNVPESAVIAIPNDATNRARALNLLSQCGLIKLSKTDLTVTVDDIVENKNNLEIREMAADTIPTVAVSVDYEVMNGNYAMSIGVSVDDALAVEDQESSGADLYANVIVVRKEDVSSDKTKALMDALKDARVQKYFEEFFGNSAIYVYKEY